MQPKHVIRPFRDGSSQALHIPRDLELPDHQATLHKQPLPKPSLVELLASWEPLIEEFPEIDDLGPLQGVDL